MKTKKITMQQNTSDITINEAWEAYRKAGFPQMTWILKMSQIRMSIMNKSSADKKEINCYANQYSNNYKWKVMHSLKVSLKVSDLNS